MNKRFVKLVTVISALTLVLPVFALVGCTDKTPKERELNAVELQLVGTWKDKDNMLITFMSDGTCDIYGTIREFRQEGDAVMGVGDKYGHFYWIYTSKTSKYPNCAYFDDEPDRLYTFSEGQYTTHFWERVID